LSGKYDVIVLGSGIGGLTCGAFLAREGMRVLVLEKHSVIGGYAHSFERNAFRFEPGVHSVPFAKDGFIFYLLRLLDIENMVTTIRHPSMYSVQAPFGEYVMPALLDDIRHSLCSDFPRERSSLERMFADMQNFYNTLITPLFRFEEKLEERDRDFIARYTNLSYKDYIDSFISNETLRNIFYSQWPYTGSSPDYAPVIFSVLLFFVHALEGSHYLKGGFSTLADALASVITSGGGEVRVDSAVQRLRAEGKKAVSVTLDTGEELTASLFVSNICPYSLHSAIIEEHSRHKMWQRRLSHLQPSVSAVAVYLGLKNDISSVFGNNMAFWYDTSDFHTIFQNIQNNVKRPLDHLAFLKTPDASEKKTLLIMTYFNQSYCGTWKSEKMIIAEEILAAAEKCIPGLKDNIEVMVTASPDTFMRYTANANGAIFGFESTRNIYGEAKLPPTTYLGNLYQTGHWSKPGGGIWNVMESGYTLSKIILQSG